MLPFLPGTDGTNAGSPVSVPPPPGLRLPSRIMSAGWSTKEVKFPPGKTAAQKAGLRYEAKVLLELQDIFLGGVYLSPTLFWIDETGVNYAVPDALILDEKFICCVEIKFLHQPEAWWQLRKKYEPILRKIYPDTKILLLEICSSLDAHSPFPEKYTYVEHLPPFIKNAKDGELGVFQWKL